MSVKCNEIIALMERLAPEATAEGWDNVGLMVGSPQADISKILFALDCSDAVLDEAIEIKANMIITHHPFIFKGIKNINYNTPLSKKIVKAIKNDIAIYSAHTNLDIAEGGTNTTLANLLELQNVEGLYQLSENMFMGKVGSLKNEMSFGDFIDFTKNKLKTDKIVVSGNAETKITKVGLCTGKGTDADFMLSAVEKGCQCYVTGDLGYHDGQLAENIGLCVIDGTHYLTENIVVPQLCKYIQSNASEVQCICSRVNGQTINIV